MLSFLRIQNLAIIEETEITFTDGLNVISGETGAGKSILLEAIELLCGKKATVELIRAGCERCSVEGSLSITPAQREALLEVVPGLEDVLEGEEVLIRRIIEANGKSRCIINGALSSMKQLQTVSEVLLDVTRQHAQQVLLRDTAHRELLDSYGVPNHLKVTLAEKYREYAAASRDLESMLRSSAEQADRIRLLRLEQEELSALALKRNEREELEAELQREAHSEQLLQLTNDCVAILQDGEHAVERQVKRALRSLERAASIDSKLGELKQLLETASIEISEVVISCNDYQSSLETDPDYLEKLRERVTHIARMERKFGRPANELCDYFEKINLELDQFDSGAFDEKSLRARLEQTKRALHAVELQLREARKEVAERLAKDVERELAELNMKKARFSVQVEPCESSIHGADSVSFTLAANPGEPFQPLSRVASGGELSRVLLVLKALMAKQLTPSVHVFDEIDSGIGGAVAQVVGEKLLALAANAQVIAVTHAPQVAALAHSHLAVEKRILDGRTRSITTTLTANERVQHIAAMLAGKEITSAFEDSAKQLLAARSIKQGKDRTARKKRANS